MSDPTSRVLLIRADASPRMGTGHVMRCLAMAQFWQRRGGQLLFAQAETTHSLTQRLRRDSIKTIPLIATPGTEADATQTAKLALDNKALWVVADGYSFGGAWQRQIKDAGLRLCILDDYGHADRYWADFILNQNLDANPRLYVQRAPYTRLLLGARYALLRDQFDAWRNWHREIAAVARNVLVTLGGTDPDNVTSTVIEWLIGLDVEAKVVVSGSNPRCEILRAKIARMKNIELIVDTNIMPELMAWADVAVAAGGTTSWELAFMGLPCLLLELAENQSSVVNSLDAHGIACKTKPETVAPALASLLADSDRRQFMSQRGRQLIDGRGGGRVVARLQSEVFSLRRVVQEDCRLVWEWANDSEARAVSLSSEIIPWETHQNWFAARLLSPECLFYIAANPHGVPIGQIRFDVVGNEAIVSVNLTKEARGRGCGAALIVRGSEQCFDDLPLKIIRAYIKIENEASVRAFTLACYTDEGFAEVRGRTVRQFVLRRENCI